MPRAYIKVFFDWADATTELTLEEKGRLIDAMVAHAQGQPYTINGNERFVFPSFRLQIDRDIKSYEDLSEKRKKAGALGGQQTQANRANATKTEHTPSKTSKCYQDQDHDHDHDHDHDYDYESEGKPSRSKNKVFSSPTLEMIKEYVRQENLAMDPEAFFDYYEANGWTVKNGNRMQNWKSSAKMWAKREKQFSPPAEIPQSKVKFFDRGAEHYQPPVKFLD